MLCLAGGFLVLLSFASAPFGRMTGLSGKPVSNAEAARSSGNSETAAGTSKAFAPTIAFEPNMGQTDPRALFLAHTAGGTAFFTATGMILSFAEPIPPEDRVRPISQQTRLATVPRTVLAETYVAANPNTKVSPSNPLAGKVNYIVGNDPARWRAGLPTYAGITYTALYPGVDMSYTAANGGLESTFTVAPGAEPSVIRWQYAGSTGLLLDDDGDLIINLSAHAEARGPARTIRVLAPTAWQEEGAARRAVSVAYDVGVDGSVGFKIGAYDRGLPLIIDPTLVYSTYLGGLRDEQAFGKIAVNLAGEAIVTGYTNSLDFPTSSPYQAAPRGSLGTFTGFISKLNAAGTELVFSTYFGGSGGDFPLGVATNTAGEIYVTGYTVSGDFPTVSPIQASYGGNTDAFVAKFNPSGSTLLYSTYLGGSGFDAAQGIAATAGGRAVVTGLTTSLNFPTMNPFQPANRGGEFGNDGFLTQLSGDGSALIYSTYFGGTGNDGGNSVAVDAAGNAYITGGTVSTDLDLVNPVQSVNNGDIDIFVTKFNPTASALLYSTYVGGSGADYGYAIAVDGAGGVYFGGTTDSSDFPTKNAFQSSGSGFTGPFVAKISAGGGTLAYSTYLGNGGINGIAVDAFGSAYVTGYAFAGFPTREPIQASFGGAIDAFVTVMNPAGSDLLFSTYLGGSGSDVGAGIAVDPARAIYVTGNTYSLDFPTQNPIQANNPGALANFADAFVTKISPPPQPPTPIISDWSIIPSPNNSAVPLNFLQGVTCVSASDCWSVGFSSDGNVNQTLIEHWDGNAWSVVPSPNTSTTTSNVLAGVTCTSASDCWAVGNYINPDLRKAQTLILRWDGNVWSIVPSPNADPTKFNYLASVTCTSASDCWAVGYYNDLGVPTQRVIERWDGTLWTVVPPAVTTRSGTGFNGVTCASASDCWAVGFAAGSGPFSQTHIEHWNGTSWSEVPSPNARPDKTSFLASVTCVSSSDCWAVGRSFTDDLKAQTFTEHWNGTAWSVVPSPNTSPTSDNFLNGVTCTSASECWAAGAAAIGSTFQSLIERWDGSAWTIVPTPNTNPTKNNVLFGVTCASADDCWAAGYANAETAGVLQTLTLRYRPNLGVKILSIARLENGRILLRCAGVPNQAYLVQASPDLVTRFARLPDGDVTADGNGVFQYEDTNATNFEKRFYRLALP